MGHILAIHPGALGDVLLAVPALRALRAGSAGPLLIGAQPRLGDLLVALGEVDRAVGFDGLRLSTLMTEDGPADLPAAVREAERLVCWFGARDPAFARRLAAVVPGAVIAPPGGVDAGLVWRHLLATVGGADGEWCRPIEVPPPVGEAGRRALLGAGWDGSPPLVIVQPGAGGVAKRWPADGFAAVVAALRARRRCGLVLHQGPADQEAVRALAGRLGVRVPVLVEPGLAELAGALGQAALLVGNDSGVSHLAAAVGTPSVVLFAEANLAWRPWSAAARVAVVRTTGLDRADVDAVSAGAVGLLG